MPGSTQGTQIIRVDPEQPVKIFWVPRNVSWYDNHPIILQFQVEKLQHQISVQHPSQCFPLE